MTFPTPAPDYRRILKVLELEEPDRLPLFEIYIDTEIRCAILGEEPISPLPDDPESLRQSILQTIRFWHLTGHDVVPYFIALEFPMASRVTEDTACLSRGRRGWREESVSQIQSFEDLERYPWPEPGKFNSGQFEFLANNLPEGMALMPVVATVHEYASGLMGTESYLVAMVEQPELVDAVCEKTTEIFFAAYEKLCDLEAVRILCPGDDWGFKTGPFMGLKGIRRWLLPVITRISELAHRTGRKMVFHSCGNMYIAMEELIETAKIDGKHSFEDVILPAREFKARYGDRVATLGGVDVNRFALDEPEDFRRHVRQVIDDCFPGGGFAIGSGNSVTNYCRVENYRVYLEEVWRAGGRI
jgi:uroporphyrinogen decarboxylase